MANDNETSLDKAAMLTANSKNGLIIYGMGAWLMQHERARYLERRQSLLAHLRDHDYYGHKSDDYVLDRIDEEFNLAVDDCYGGKKIDEVDDDFWERIWNRTCDSMEYEGDEPGEDSFDNGDEEMMVQNPFCEVDGEFPFLYIEDYETWDDENWAYCEERFPKSDETLSDLGDWIINQCSHGYEFLKCACKRRPGLWGRVFLQGGIDTIVVDILDEDASLLSDAEFRKFIINWCNAGGRTEEGFWEEEDFLSGFISERVIEGVELEYPSSRWAFVLSISPSIVPDFAWETLRGVDCCLVLAYQPAVSAHIDLEKLNDPTSDLWSNGNGEPVFVDAWMWLLCRQPRFAKHFTHWDLIDDSYWEELGSEFLVPEELARHRKR